MRKMKLLAVAGLAISLLVGGSHSVGAVENTNADSHVVFYVPHQDDETLTFGVAIVNHLRYGHDVHVVLLTDGAASVIRERLGMTKEEFTAARNREFLYALQVMGVKSENISIRNFADGQLTVDQVAGVMKEYESRFPGAKHKTFTETDPHPDHSNSGKALRKLQNAGVVTDARYYVKMTHNYTLPVMKETFKEEYREVLEAAGSVYNINNPSIGFYGIGYKSVPKSFDAHAIQPVSKYHK